MTPLAILYTTFLRDALMYRTANELFSLMGPNHHLFVADQGNQRVEKTEFFGHRLNCNFYSLNYDAGLSFSRNYLVNRCNLYSYKYCLLTADSLLMTQPLEDLNKLIDFMDLNPSIGIIGFQDMGKPRWIKNIDLIKGQCFRLTKVEEVYEHKELKLIKCDVVPNFFLARVKTLLENKWDDDLCLCEHEDFFWRLKQTSWKVYFSDLFSCQHIKDEPKEYLAKRDRLYHEFRDKLKKKYNIQNWKEEKC